MVRNKTSTEGANDEQVSPAKPRKLPETMTARNPKRLLNADASGPVNIFESYRMSYRIIDVYYIRMIENSNT